MPRAFLECAIQLHITGNGPASEPTPKAPLAGFTRVVFNLPDPTALSRPGLLHVSNGQRLGVRERFVITASEDTPINVRSLAKRMVEKAAALEEELQTWPSTGLALVHSVWDRAERLVIDRMPLAASLQRPHGMSPHRALSCAYHNWLGERRLSLLRLHRSPHPSLTWTSLMLAKPDAGTRRQGDPVHELLTAATTSSTVPWQKLAEVDPEHWLAHLDGERLISFEPLFFLPRGAGLTRNWWLYHNAASHCAARVHRSLLWCQQVLLPRVPTRAASRR